MDFLLELAWKNAAVAFVLALTAAIVGRTIRRPALTHALWLLVLVKLVTPPLWHLSVPWPTAQPESNSVVQSLDPGVPESPVQPALTAEAIAQILTNAAMVGISPSAPSKDAPLQVASTPVAIEPIESLATLPDQPTMGRAAPWVSWQQSLAVVWLVGSSAWLAIFLIRLRRFRRLAGFATLASELDCQRVAELAARIGLRRVPVLRLVNARVPPMTWGIGSRHEMLVPTYLWNALPAAQRDALILHELAHLKRGDHWVRQFELLVFVLHWWHPVSWWARHELQKAEEECCDAWVVRGLPNIAGDYAELIVETIAYLAQPPSPALPPLASGLGHIRHVRKRLAAILGGSAAPRLSLAAWAAVAATGIFLLPMIPTTNREAQAGGLSELEPSIDNGSLRGTGALRGRSNPSSISAGAGQTELDPPWENLAILRLQLVQREAELTEERLLLEQAGRIAQRGTALAARGAAALSVLEESLTDQKVREARVRGREAGVQELELLIKREESRVNKENQRVQARASLEARTSNEFKAGLLGPDVNPPPARKSPEENRLERIENRLDDLFAEARALAEELKREREGKE